MIVNLGRYRLRRYDSRNWVLYEWRERTRSSWCASVAQIVVIPYATARLVRVDGLEETDRGDGCFGSTGVARG